MTLKMRRGLGSILILVLGGLVILGGHAIMQSGPASHAVEASVRTEAEPNAKPFSVVTSEKEQLANAPVPAGLRPSNSRRLPPFRERTPSQAAPQNVRPSARTFATGQKINSNSGAFELLALRAVPTDEYRESLGEFVFERMGRSFYRDNSENTLRSISDARSFGVVIKSANGMPGLVTGVLLVTLKDGVEAKAFASEAGLGLKTFDLSLRRAYLSVPNGSSVFEILNHLRQAPEVENADPEILLTQKKF